MMMMMMMMFGNNGSLILTFLIWLGIETLYVISASSCEQATCETHSLSEWMMLTVGGLETCKSMAVGSS